jgi:ATP-dependent Lon protease
MAIASNLDEPGRLADLVASNLELKVEKAQQVLELVDPVERLRRVHELLTKELEVLEVQSDINAQARGEIVATTGVLPAPADEAIQQELGEGNELQEEIDHTGKNQKGQDAA